MSLKGTKTTTTYLEWDVFTSLISKLERDENYKFCLLITIGVFTGLRISDLLTLKFSDILGKDKLFIKEKKTGKQRSILINRDLRDIVERIYKKLNVSTPTTLIFVNKYGTKPIDKSYVNVKLKEIMKWYRIKVDGNISSHTFRKTLGRRVVEKNDYSGESLLLLMDLFGHSSPSITKRYLGIREQEIHEIYSSLNL